MENASLLSMACCLFLGGKELKGGDIPLIDKLIGVRQRRQLRWKDNRYKLSWITRARLVFYVNRFLGRRVVLESGQTMSEWIDERFIHLRMNEKRSVRLRVIAGYDAEWVYAAQAAKTLGVGASSIYNSALQGWEIVSGTTRVGSTRDDKLWSALEEGMKKAHAILGELSQES